MARSHIEYLQSQSLPWQPSPWPHLGGCHTKVLSRDPIDGAVSLLVRFPAGWQTASPGYLSATEEMFVLEGALDVNGRRWDQDCYAWFPAGFAHARRAAPEGAVALVFYDAEPEWTVAHSPAHSPAIEQAIFCDAYEMSWEAVPHLPLAGPWVPAQKVLRSSPDSLTMLVAFPVHMHPPHWVGRQELRACTEEMFLLSGDCLTNTGQMFPGAYYWRPPGMAHGPNGSRGGNLALLRAHGAPLTTTFTSHEVALARTPEYQPVLPRELSALRTRPWRPQQY
jgi:hypothetical protein